GAHPRPAPPLGRCRPLGPLLLAFGARRRLGGLLGLLCLLGRDQACLEELVAEVLHGAGTLLTTPRVPDESPVLGFVGFRAALFSCPHHWAGAARRLLQPRRPRGQGAHLLSGGPTSGDRLREGEPRSAEARLRPEARSPCGGH